MIDKENLYPILFTPIYMERMWGGNKLKTCLGREVPDEGEPIGESWELVDRNEIQSIVANGDLKGCTMHELVEHYGKDLIGDSFEGNRFPLLVKLIDAGKRLSLQVHPDDAACSKIGDGAESKTEMWYVIFSEKGAKIMAGLKGSAIKRQFMDSLESPEIENFLQVFDSRPGDAFFISAGRIHSIGAGNLLLEIQQNSDTTYRVSDWGRVDSDGNPRELQLEKALKCIDFVDRTSPRICGVSDSVVHNRKFPIINKCPFFRVDDLRLVDKWRDNTETSHSFHLVTPVDNPVSIGRDNTFVRVEKGTTCLIPACYGSYTISLENNKTNVVRTSL